MDAEQVLAFRLARSGLAPASDFHRDAAFLALAARTEGLTRESYDRSVDAGELVVAHVIRGAIHAVAPDHFALWGRALIARDDAELLVQMGEQMKRLAAEKGFSAAEALDEVATATQDALAKGSALDKNALHEELRQRVSGDLLPWCKGCGSHHVAPMLWRYGTVKAGARLDSERRYVQGKPGRTPAASEAIRRFLYSYGPSTVGDFTDWAGLSKPQGKRLWDEVADELAEVSVGKDRAWHLSDDLSALESAPAAEGILLLPPGDPYLQKPNRPLLTPDKDLRRRLYRPVASPGAVLKDGRPVALWRAKLKGKRLDLTVEKLGRVARGDLEDEAERMAQLRGAREAAVVLA